MLFDMNYYFPVELRWTEALASLYRSKSSVNIWHKWNILAKTLLVSVLYNLKQRIAYPRDPILWKWIVELGPMLGAKRVIALQVTNKVGFSLGFSFAFALQKPNLLVRQVQCDKLSLKCICPWESALLENISLKGRRFLNQLRYLAT